MFSQNTKSTIVKAAQPARFQLLRRAAADRGLAASRGVTAATRTPSRTVRQQSAPTERVGTAITFLLSLVLVVSGSMVVAQIWANQAMIR